MKKSLLALAVLGTLAGVASAQSSVTIYGRVDESFAKPMVSKDKQIADGGTTTYFLTTFGRANRDTVCACDVKTEPTLSQALHMINGDTIQGKIAQGGKHRIIGFGRD
mgnify:CR=1 FL=1